MHHIGWSMLTQFQMMAGDDWSQVMRDLQVSLPFCTVQRGVSDCGGGSSIAFFTVFYALVVFIFLNLFVAVILDNFSACYSKEGLHISEEAFEQYRTLWFEFDRKKRGYFPIWQLRNFLNVRGAGQSARARPRLTPPPSRARRNCRPPCALRMTTGSGTS